MTTSKQELLGLIDTYGRHNFMDPCATFMYREFKAAIERHIASESPVETSDGAMQAPIVKITVGDNYLIERSDMYAPGLPPGEHDLYCEPPAPGGEKVPHPAFETDALPDQLLDVHAICDERDHFRTRLGSFAEEKELFCQVSQLISGWKQGCDPGEWTEWDEQVLKCWQAWRAGLAKKAIETPPPNETIDEIMCLPEPVLRERYLAQKSWIRSYAHCLDGLVNSGADYSGLMPDAIRRAYEARVAEKTKARTGPATCEECHSGWDPATGKTFHHSWCSLKIGVTSAPRGVGNEFDIIKAAIHSDPEYGWSWHCNLAMPILDAGVGITHQQANEAAAHLMQHLFRFDSKACKEWQWESEKTTEPWDCRCDSRECAYCGPRLAEKAGVTREPWKCKCGQLNSDWAMECGRCERQPPN